MDSHNLSADGGNGRPEGTGEESKERVYDQTAVALPAGYPDHQCRKPGYQCRETSNVNPANPVTEQADHGPSDSLGHCRW